MGWILGLGGIFGAGGGFFGAGGWIGATRARSTCEADFAARPPCLKCLRGWSGVLVKFTFGADPRQKAFWGTLASEVNFTARGTPCQKYLRSLSGNPVKFTFRADPLQKAFWGRLPFEVERFCVHLRASPPLQCPQRHIGS